MPRRLRVSAQAARDIDRIGVYSQQCWGIEVAVRYLTGLDAAMKRLRRQPLLDSNYGEVMPGVRRYLYRSHVLYYTVSDESVRIVRILHVRMSPKRHLP
jgi:toxin ParE1/3/4